MLRATLSLAALAAVPAVFAELPPAFPITRYDPMAAECPFAVAAAVADAEPEEPVGNIMITGMARVVDENGQQKDVVHLKNRTDNELFTLKTGEPTQGYELVAVAWSDQSGKSTAEIKGKSGKLEKVKFSEEAAPVAIVQPRAPAAAPRPGGPGQPTGLGGARPGQPGIPQAINPANRIATPMPTNIPRPPGAIPTPAPAGGPQANPNNPNNKTRVRVINSK